jgi:hypothetical protein
MSGIDLSKVRNTESLAESDDVSLQQMFELFLTIWEKISRKMGKDSINK